MGTRRPRALFLHTLPHVALAETSAASRWVTDSAAGMTAIVTGRKTHNGVRAHPSSETTRSRCALENVRRDDDHTGEDVLARRPAALTARVHAPFVRSLVSYEV